MRYPITIALGVFFVSLVTIATIAASRGGGSTQAVALTHRDKSHKTISSEHPFYREYFTGNPDNVSPDTKASLLLVGGGEDRDDAMQWFIDRAGHGDILILRESGSDGYNDWLMDKGADSVDTIVVRARQASFDPVLLDKINSAEGIFFAGGDQSNDVKFFKDTPLAAAINAAAARGVPIGGTSAGLAIMGQYLYAAFGESLRSSAALQDPYHRDLTLDRDFLALPRLDHVITDSHFQQRDRMGRLITFMARLLQDGWTTTTSIRGLGINEQTAIGIDEHGSGRLFADDGHQAFILSANQTPSICKQGQPLSFHSIKIDKLSPESVIDFNSWSVHPVDSSEIQVDGGIITSADGSIY